MKLKRLLSNFPDIKIRGPKDVEITGVCSDSRVVAPGNLFIARKGLKHDGSRYVASAVNSGAAAILTDLYDPSLRGVTQLIHEQPAELESKLAAHYYGYPSRKLFSVGVTGTNGKTTTTFLIKHLLDSVGTPCGLIGSIENIVGPVHLNATRTTPSPTLTHKLLSDMVRAECKAVVMEVTSHGLVQGRVRDIVFDIGLFTNLSPDHLDYHGTMEDYAEAKSLLFQQVKYGIVNGDSPWHPRMIRNCLAPILSFGFDPSCDLRAQNLELSLERSQFEVVFRHTVQKFQIPLVGRFNIYNCLAAIAVGCIRNLPLELMAEILHRTPPVPGRLQPVPNCQGRRIFVDYAHTPDGLEQVLLGLREGGANDIVTVFGCGGDRDQLKRPLMGEVAARLSSKLIITSDNPRSEDPSTICQQIVTRLSPSETWEICLDRKEAIARALSHSSQDAVVLIAGKGHETVQLVGQQAIPFDDVQVAKSLLA